MGRFFLWIESIIPYIMTYAQYKRTHRNTTQHCNLCFVIVSFHAHENWTVCAYLTVRQSIQLDFISSCKYIRIFSASSRIYTYGRLQSYTLHVTLLYVWLGLCEYYRIYLIATFFFRTYAFGFWFNCFAFIQFHLLSQWRLFIHAKCLYDFCTNQSTENTK